MGRAPGSSKVMKGEGLNKGPWTAEEDSVLTAFVKANGEGNWRTLPKLAGLKRCRKSCRLRWMNYLRPDLKRGNFSPDEDELIIKLHTLLGNRWSLIAGRIPGRTDNEIKNYWNSRLKRKLQYMEGNHSKQLEATPLSVSLLNCPTEIKVEDFSCSSQSGMSGPPSPLNEKSLMEASLKTHHHSNDLEHPIINTPQLLNCTDFHAMPQGESTVSEPTSSDGTCFEESCDHQSLEGYSSLCNWASFEDTQKPLSFTQASSPESVLLFQQDCVSHLQDDFLSNDFTLPDFASNNFIQEFMSFQNLLQCGPFSPFHKNLAAT